MGKQVQGVTYNARSTHFCLLALSTKISFPVKIVVGNNPIILKLGLMQIPAFQQTSSQHK